MECVTLPVELIEIILSLAWMLPLETEERVQFMLASTLVSTTWREVYQHVSSAHIHIPRTSYIPHLQKMLLASVPETRTFACHSISLVLDFAKPASQASPADSYSSFLTHLKSHELPKLQDISIEFANANLNNIVQTLSSAPLPETVTNLQLKWASSPSPLTTTTSSTCGPPRGKLFLPTISTARITGGSADLVVMVVSACWNLLGLQISSNDGKNSGESEIGSSKGAERRKGMTKNLCETGTQMTVFKDGFIGYATVPIWVGQLVSERNGVKEYRRTFRRMLHA